MRFALDTNTIIYAFKGLGNVRERLSICARQDLVIPAIVAHELGYGTLASRNPSQRRRGLDLLLQEIEILPLDGKSAEIAAGVRLDLETRGERIGPLDLLIAGTVLAAGAILVTHNQKEFSRVRGLKIEDWY